MDGVEITRLYRKSGAVHAGYRSALPTQIRNNGLG
jgi:hypothetical protein